MVSGGCTVSWLAVRWILPGFGARSRARAALVCYLRENGPIAYATDLFGAAPRDRAEAMLSAPLTWYWRTAAPAARDWTQLTRWSLAALMTDTSAEPGGGPARVLLIGVDAPERHVTVTDARVAAWTRAFAAAAAGPLHAVISRPGPGGDLLFVAQQPPEAVRDLLHAWGIDRDKAHRLPYARLQGASLEELARLVTADSGR